jgi:hypothetical protein
VNDDPSSALVGTWRLLSIHVEMADGNGRVDLLGPRPAGRMIIAGDGQMICILTAGNAGETQEPRIAEPLYYAGRYRIEGGDKFVVKCDVAWNPAWIGTEQVRFFELRGDKLSVRSGLVAHPALAGRQGYGVIDWQREPST